LAVRSGVDHQPVDVDVITVIAPGDRTDQLHAAPRHQVAATPRRQRDVVVLQGRKPVVPDQLGLGTIGVVLKAQELAREPRVESRVRRGEDHGPSM
jgi:hypothetical protein